MTQPYLPFEPATPRFARFSQALRELTDAGREVLTPQAAMYLFDLSEASVRRARLKDQSSVRFALMVTDRHVWMLDLEWAIQQWGPIVNQRRERLDKMRKNQQLFCLFGKAYLVLHPKPVAWEGPQSEMDSMDGGRLEDLPVG